jgi:hypothetical protein
MIHDKLRSIGAAESQHAAAASSSPHHPLLHKLSEAASALKAQQQILHQQQGNGKRLPSMGGSGQGVDAFRVPVVYRQWHPEVTVLFADVASYTSLSTQVEPEQVRTAFNEDLGAACVGVLGCLRQLSVFLPACLQ